LRRRLVRLLVWAIKRLMPEGTDVILEWKNPGIAAAPVRIRTER